MSAREDDEKHLVSDGGNRREHRGDGLRNHPITPGTTIPITTIGIQQPAQHQARRAATGAAVGAVGGAVAGAVSAGVKPGEGAVAGAILGGVLGAVIKGRQYYRDTRGYCYYVDQYGHPVYDYNTRC